MGVDNKVRQIYEQVIHEVTQSQDAWKSVLRLAGQIYRYEFDNILMVYAQKPHATLVADFDTWKKVGRFVKCGSKGAAIYPSKALKPYMRYVFDISDTGGRQTKLTWDLEGDSLEKFMNYQTENGRYPAYERLSREDSVTALKDFTKQMVQEIMEEEFGERISEFSQITGSVIIEENEKRESLQHTENIYDIVKKSILYVVGTRCGFDLSAEEQDFSQIVNITDEDMIYRLGSLICDVSCNVLRAYGRDCEAATKERRIAYGSRDELQGGRPDLQAPDETENLTQIGKYGLLAMNYLKENEETRYKSLLRFGRMTEKMKEVDEEANHMLDQLMTQYLKSHRPVNPSSTMEMWKLREQAKMMAEEIVLTEIVYRYH